MRKTNASQNHLCASPLMGTLEFAHSILNSSPLVACLKNYTCSKTFDKNIFKTRQEKNSFDLKDNVHHSFNQVELNNTYNDFKYQLIKDVINQKAKNRTLFFRKMYLQFKCSYKKHKF